MVNLIVNNIVTSLASLPFKDKLTGIVKPATVSDSQGNSKTFPIAYNTDVCVCTQTELMDYVPDSSKMSIIYFEDRGTSVTSCDGGYVNLTSNFTLVCWFNFKLIGCITDTSLVALNILKYIDFSPGNITPLNAVFVSLTGQQAADGGVFSKYSYSEEISQYITYPYGYVALDFAADYKLRTDCIEDLEPCSGPCL